MSPIGVAGAGAFGTALAVALARQGRIVRLWARDPDVARRSAASRNMDRLSGIVLPDSVSVTADFLDFLDCDTVLIATPMQALAGFLAVHGRSLAGRRVIACCKGVDLATLVGPTTLIQQACPNLTPMILTGPSFADDIARGMATALTLGCVDETQGIIAQNALSGSVLRVYRNTDVAGCELGGALKNVVAIASGIVIGAGLGESARAALMTRGFAEMVRFASHFGAQPQTLMGLAGLGDLVLTCTSTKSRNFRHGLALGRGEQPESEMTVEGVATARAILLRAQQLGLTGQIPVTEMVANVTQGQISIAAAVQALMSRPLKEE